MINEVSQQVNINFSQSNLFNMNHSDFMEFCSNLFSHIQGGSYRMEIARHLAQAASYVNSPNHPESNIPNDNRMQRQVFIFEKFLICVQQFYKEQRCLFFYADKLCMTPKYLSSVVKKHSGKTAAKWIDEFVVSEAKVLLKSTNLTIQQISDELNFSSQSFFGTYFKRHVGISPKEYIKTISSNLVIDTKK